MKNQGDEMRTLAKWLRLAATFIDMASDRFGDDICTDWEFPDDWTDEQRTAAVVEYHDWNGDPEEAEGTQLQNFSAMGLAAQKVRLVGEMLSDGTPAADEQERIMTRADNRELTRDEADRFYGLEAAADMETEAQTLRVEIARQVSEGGAS